jgi:uncharacterized membrane protein YfcA
MVVCQVLFILLTWRFGANARAASVTSIALVGWLSALAFAVRELSLHLSPAGDSPLLPSDIGRVPYLHWLVVLPGILVGSVCGPWINLALGSRRIMVAFVLLLLVEVARYVAAHLGHAIGHADGGAAACRR